MVREEEVYDDEDDENEESNWRNDYPDEDSGSDSDREQRYGGRPLSAEMMGTSALLLCADGFYVLFLMKICFHEHKSDGVYGDIKPEMEDLLM